MINMPNSSTNAQLNGQMNSQLNSQMNNHQMSNSQLNNRENANPNWHHMALHVSPVGQQLPTLAEWNQRYIEFVLNFTNGKKAAAARILGINRRTLYRRKTERAIDEHLTSIEVSTSHPG